MHLRFGSFFLLDCVDASGCLSSERSLLVLAGDRHYNPGFRALGDQYRNGDWADACGGDPPAFDKLWRFLCSLSDVRFRDRAGSQYAT